MSTHTHTLFRLLWASFLSSWDGENESVSEREESKGLRNRRAKVYGRWMESEGDTIPRDIVVKYNDTDPLFLSTGVCVCV